MYKISISIGAYHTDAESCVAFSTIYRAGRSLVKCGKRNRFKVRYIVRDAETNRTVVRFYCYQRVSGEWVARQSIVGKYHTHIEF